MRFLSDNITTEISNDEAGILEDIREAIFSLPLLPQRQVVRLFGLLDRSLQETVDILLAKSNFVETYLADVISEVAASVTHGRTIYGGAKPASADHSTGVTRVVFKRASDVRFLEQGINVMHQLAAYQLDDDPPPALKRQTRQILSGIRFVRLAYEEVLHNFMYATARYIDETVEAAHVHKDLYGLTDHDAASRAHDRYADLNDRLRAAEESVGVERPYLYHVCRYVRRVYEDQLRIRDRICEPYLRIVYKEAKKHATTDQQVLDNFQNGAQGLLRAISCYDLNKNVSFSSYAHWWIRQSILFHIKDSSNFVKLPVGVWQTFTSIEKKRAKLKCRGQDNLDALAVATGHTTDKLKEVYDAVRSSHVHSLDYEVDETGKMMLIDVIADDRPEENKRQQDIVNNVRDRLTNLTVDQRWATMLHYGLFDMLAHKAPIGPTELERERARQLAAAASPFCKDPSKGFGPTMRQTGQRGDEHGKATVEGQEVFG